MGVKNLRNERGEGGGGLKYFRTEAVTNLGELFLLQGVGTSLHAMVMVFKMSKMAHFFVFSADESKKSVTGWRKCLRK